MANVEEDKLVFHGELLEQYREEFDDVPVIFTMDIDRRVAVMSQALATGDKTPEVPEGILT